MFSPLEHFFFFLSSVLVCFLVVLVQPFSAAEPLCFLGFALGAPLMWGAPLGASMR